MKKIINSLKTVTKNSEGVLALLSAGLLLPLIILAGFGLYTIITAGHWILFSLLLTLSAALVTFPLFLFRENIKAVETQLEQSDENLVEASKDWSEFDHQVWEQLNQSIQQQLEENDNWSSLKEHSLGLIAQTAHAYKRNELAFSLPESLKMFEEVSRRYRGILKEHVPLVEQIKVSHLKLGFDYKDQATTGAKAASWLYNAYRVFRVTNPYAAVLAEVRSKILSEVFDGISTKLQYQLKQALLQEVVSVAIDLYSGRFKVDDSEIQLSEAHQIDQQRTALIIEPLRIGLIGQVSVGKSSLVNALLDDIVADVHELPSTQTVSIYECDIEGQDVLHLVDLPGLDGNPNTTKQLLEEATHCDIILWVLKANQSSKQLDTDFQQALDHFYQRDENLSRKRPVIIAVLNHVDRLQPISEWSPPYDLAQDDSRKAQTIVKALEYNQQLLGFSELLPLCVAENKDHFNLDTLKTALNEQYQEALYTQLNRRQQEAGRFDFKTELKRLGKAGQSLFKLATAQNKKGTSD